MHRYARRFIGYPSVERVRFREPEYKRTKSDSLHDAAHPNGGGSRHFELTGPTKHVWPCQPIITVLPSSTSAGTEDWPVTTFNRSNALASSDTSNSVKSRPFHSSQSRISRV